MAGLTLLLARGVAAQQDSFALAYAYVDSFVVQHMREGQVPGTVIAVTDRRQLLHLVAFGFADLAAHTPLTPETRFPIGSLSKSFTAIALLQLREEGVVAFDRPVTDYLPWFKVKSSFPPITIAHLLTHSAGLPRDRNDLPSSPYSAVALRDMEPPFAPGERFAYSNLGYQLLSLIIEEVEGKPFAASVSHRILEPLDLRSTEAEITQDTRDRAATGYQYFYDDRPPYSDHPLVPAQWTEQSAGDVNVVSTAGDMATYLRVLLNEGRGSGGRILQPASFSRMVQRKIRAPEMGADAYYGYGLVLNRLDGSLTFGHSGGMPGFRAAMLADQEEEFGVVVLMNGPGTPQRVADYALRVLRATARHQPLPPVPVAAPATEIGNAADYVGGYVDSLGRRMELQAQGTGLMLDWHGRKLPLKRMGPDQFYSDDPDLNLFPLQAERRDGRVVELLHGDAWFPRDGAGGRTGFDFPKEWQNYPGHYRAQNPFYSNFRVVLRKGRLLLVAPEGTEELLVPLERGRFRVGNDARAVEVLEFDTVVSGRALRAILSGVDYYRTPTP